MNTSQPRWQAALTGYHDGLYRDPNTNWYPNRHYMTGYLQGMCLRKAAEFCADQPGYPWTAIYEYPNGDVGDYYYRQAVGKRYALHTRTTN